MTFVVDGTNGLTFPNSSTQTSAGASLTTPSFTSTIGVGSATASASGAGITFPATQSTSSNANTLDDYEEGTWTPNVIDGTNTYALRNGSYVKIGRVVYIQGFIVLTTGTGNGNRIDGLPFTASGQDVECGITMSYFANLASSVYWLTGETTGTQLYFRGTTAATANIASPGLFGNSAQIEFGGTYITST